MNRANPLWGASRIHGELLKLGIDTGERTVSRLLPKPFKPPSRTWRTFLENHARDIVSLDFFTVSTLGFRVLFVLIVLSHERRRVVHFKGAAEPLAESKCGADDLVDRQGGLDHVIVRNRRHLWRILNSYFSY